MTADLALDRAVQRRALARRPRGLARIGALGVALASMLVVIGLWSAGGGPADLMTSPADGLISVGRLAGLLASNLLLLQVVLMARVPLLERSFGQDALARVHRRVGFSSMNLLAVHIVTVILGYARLQDTNVAREAWTLTRSYPGVLLAVAGTAALVLATVTSIRVARRVLRYESWHLLHLYAYLGVGLALPHQLWTGQDFVNSPVARAYWWTMWGLAAAAILTYRVGAPAWRSLRHGLTVRSVSPEAGGAITVQLSGRAMHRLRAQAGQYFIWRFLDGPGWTRAHPYSLSAAPDGDTIRITARDDGDDPGRLARLRPGTWVLVEGPYGRLTPNLLDGRPVALLACGIGITPLRALLDEVGADAVLVHRARDLSGLALRDEVEAIAARRGARIHHLLGPRATDRASWLPASATEHTDAEALLELIPDLAERALVICGPEPWADAVQAAALAAGLPRRQLHRERFTW